MMNISKQPTPCVIALGTFDGMHPGHIAVIDRAVCVARSMNIPARVYTFYENPRDLFGAPVRKLMSPEEKKQTMLERGIDEVIMVHFTREYAAMPPEDFARLLREQYGALAVVSGEDYSFGDHARGNVDLLKRYGEAFGFEVIVTPTVMLTDERGQTLGKVSSTAIRSALDANRADIARAIRNGQPLPSTTREE